MDISLPEMECAINYWRILHPSTGEERTLSPQVNMLAGVYALMIYHRAASLPLDALAPGPRQLIESWRLQPAPAST